MTDKVAIYCRLSKEDEDLETGAVSESIKNQKLLLTDYAMNQGWQIYHIYCDEDLRGFDKDRPDFKRLLKDAEKGAFNIVLCKHQSRFTRDMELAEKYINGRFILWGIRFVSLIDNVDTNIKGNKKARQINSLINEWYSEDLSENIRAVFRKKMEDGQFLGSFAPYGYKKDPEDRHQLIIDEEAAQVVKEIYALYLGGFGVTRIASILTERKILPPTQYKRQAGYSFVSPQFSQELEKNCSWSPSSIKRILGNETYIGTLIQGRERKISYKSKKVVIAPQEQWIVVKNHHAPIIDEKTFNTVQIMRGNRKRASRKEGVVVSCPNLFAGKLVCAECGATLQRSGKAKDGSTYYYRCRISAKTKRAECSPHCIRQDTIEKAVLKKIQALVNGYLSKAVNRNSILKAVDLSCNQEKKELLFLEQETEKLDWLIKEKNKLLAKTYGEKLSGAISKVDYAIYKEVFEEEKKELEKKKESLLANILARKQCLNEDILWEDVLEQCETIDALSFDLINDFIETIAISEDQNTKVKKIIIYWNL